MLQLALQRGAARAWDSIKYYSVGLYRYVDEDHCFLLASGIAFNVLYCVLPLSLVVFYFFSTALTSERAVTTAVNYIIQSFPVPLYEEDVRMWLSRELTSVGHMSHIAGIVGGITLFWLASTLFSTLRTSLNAVLNFPSHKNVIFQKLLDFALMIVILVLLLSSTFLSPIVTLLQHAGTEILPGWLSYIMDTAVPRVVSLALSAALYLILFRMLPHERLSWPVIMVSASTTVALTEAMRLLFVYYMTHVSSIGALYGTYAFLIGISLWVYYAGAAFLIGAEVGWLYRERHEIAGIPSTMPSEPSLDQTKHPGEMALNPEALAEYEQAKSNPARPVGESKELQD
ncbi:MAG: YihY/virulence factor BrkB family protein [Bacteroidota bacterium]|nr:YihY/virulence factor BrkB family protein [Bacteroidota bacterium]MDP4243565.1 YihY/virulence factor BrkB family protein [Bacteroidota bacterium]MDP4289247.1 YihY/virulence factor BrkB family protein [Bacteroidota bacterium]